MARRKQCWIGIEEFVLVQRTDRLPIQLIVLRYDVRTWLRLGEDLVSRTHGTENSEQQKAVAIEPFSLDDSIIRDDRGSFATQMSTNRLVILLCRYSFQCTYAFLPFFSPPFFVMSGCRAVAIAVCGCLCEVAPSLLQGGRRGRIVNSLS